MNKEAKQQALINLELAMSGGSNARSEASIKKFLWESQRFLDGVKNELPTPQDAQNWWEKVKERKTKNYQNFGYWVLRALYRANKWELPESLAMGPKAPEIYEQSHPAMSKDDIVKLIKWAKGNASPEEMAMLALSTTYGLRRDEMRCIEPSDIANDTILIRTGKHRRVRRHIIPPEIKPYIDSYDFKPRLSLSHLSIMFKVCCYKAQVQCDDGMGWHTIRRSMAGILEEKIGLVNMENYMRWSSLLTSMGRRYSSPSTQDREIDLMAFKANPWLKAWGEL